MTPSPTSIERRLVAPSSDAPLRVALLCYRGNPRCGGQGVYARQLSRALVGAGHAVTVFAGQPFPELADGVDLVQVPSLDLYREPDPFRTPKLREISSPVDLLELATMWSGGFGEPRTFSLRAFAELAPRRGDFDVVHDNHGLGTGLLRLMRSGFPLVASIHHPVTVDRSIELAEATTLRKKVVIGRWYGFAAMQHRVARRLPRIITVSETARHDIVEAVGVDAAKVAVVPLGVDPSIWRPRPSVRRVPGRIMTTVSADVPMKGLVPLVEALAKVRSERDEAHLVVIGSRRDDGPVAAAIGRFGLEGVVRFVSGEPDETIARRYAECALAVVPSLYEGFSLPAVEAMACAVPLVTTTGGALPEVVGDDGEAALTVAPGDAGALASAILRLLGDDSLGRRLGAAARRRALARYSWEEVARSTVDQYRAVLA